MGLASLLLVYLQLQPSSQKVEIKASLDRSTQYVTVSAANNSTSPVSLIRHVGYYAYATHKGRRVTGGYPFPPGQHSIPRAVVDTDWVVLLPGDGAAWRVPIVWARGVTATQRRTAHILLLRRPGVDLRAEPPSIYRGKAARVVFLGERLEVKN